MKKLTEEEFFYKVTLPIVLVLALFFIAGNCSAQSYERDGNTFTQTNQRGTSSDVKTKYTWCDKEGTKYPIFITKNGRCYVVRISKKGNEYKYYLPEELSRTICKELKVEYKEKETIEQLAAFKPNGKR